MTRSNRDRLSLPAPSDFDLVQTELGLSVALRHDQDAETHISARGAGDSDLLSSPLKNSTAFEDLPSDVHAVLLSHMKPVFFREGELLLQEGSPGESLIAITSGEVDITASASDGDARFIAVAGPGAVIGEMALLTREPRSASAVARSDVRAQKLEASTYHELAREYPSLSQVLSNLVSTRLGNNRIDVLAGKTLSGYRIRHRLGKGGMAVVYAADDTRAERQVALKMMSHRLVYCPDAAERFDFEANTIRGFDHPNIVRLIDRFEAFHTYFLVLEFVEGRTLDEFIRDGQVFSSGDIQRIAGQIAAGLKYAHGCGIVHRDVKPSNVMVSPDGSVRLMDFGLACPIDDAPDTISVVGTPQYMAPEQLRDGVTSERSDCFGLGCLVFELLTGSRLVSEYRLDEILDRHANWPIATFADAYPETPPELLSEFLYSLCGDPAQRRVDLDRIARWAGPVSLNG